MTTFTRSTQRGRVVVIGGGITGLAAAHRLRASTDAHVVLLEASARLGGHVRTIDVGPLRVDTGAEALVAHQSAGIDLCNQLGLADELVAPATSQSLVWTRGKLRPLPPRLFDGIPGGTWQLARSGVVPLPGLLRASFDLIAPRSRWPEDLSIGMLVRGRLGSSVLEHLVDPVLGGIHGGCCDELDAHLLAPQLVRATREQRSLVRGLRAQAAARAQPGTRSPFRTLRGGMQILIDQLAGALQGDEHVEIRMGSTATMLHPHETGALTVGIEDGTQLDADAVVLAVPSLRAADLVERAVPSLAVRMRHIRWVSAMSGVLTFERADVRQLPNATGVVIPRRERRFLSACTFSSTKWGHLNAAEQVVLRCYVDSAHVNDDLTDEQVADRMFHDVRRLLGIEARPLATHVARFENALPQYAPGHARLVTRLESDARAALGNTTLAGASYHGPGLGSCIASAHAAAHTTAQRLATRNQIEVDSP